MLFYLKYTLKPFVDGSAFEQGSFVVSVCNETLFGEAETECNVETASRNESYVLLNIDRTLQFIRLKMNTTYFKRICEIEVFEAGMVLSTFNYSNHLAVACSFETRRIRGRQAYKHIAIFHVQKQ